MEFKITEDMIKNSIVRKGDISRIKLKMDKIYV